MNSVLDGLICCETRLIFVKNSESYHISKESRLFPNFLYVLFDRLGLLR